nr:substrate-binding domain-containing protein [Chelativorans sp. J32]
MRHGIIVVEIEGRVGVPVSGLPAFLEAVPELVTPLVEPGKGQADIGARIVRIELERSLEERAPFLVRFPGSLTQEGERIKGFSDVIAETNIKILDIQYANWNQDEAFTLMQDYLAKYPKIDAVWANDDDMLLGVIEAIDQAGRTDIKYALGGNGMKQVIEMVKEGDERTPISTPYPPSMIKSAIYMTAGQFAGQAPMRGSFLLDAPLITPENADQFYFPDSPF